MGKTICELERESDEAFDKLAEYIKEKSGTFGITSDVIDERIHAIEESEILLVVLEKYFIRTNDRVTMIIHGINDKKDKKQTITLLAVGGGTGLLNISYLTNDSYAYDWEQALKDIGFRNVEDMHQRSDQNNDKKEGVEAAGRPKFLWE